jgi:hypothetical protein
MMLGWVTKWWFWIGFFAVGLYYDQVGEWLAGLFLYGMVYAFFKIVWCSFTERGGSDNW